jgi:hypothetical protein
MDAGDGGWVRGFFGPRSARCAFSGQGLLLLRLAQQALRGPKLVTLAQNTVSA